MLVPADFVPDDDGCVRVRSSVVDEVEGDLDDPHWLIDEAVCGWADALPGAEMEGYDVRIVIRPAGSADEDEDTFVRLWGVAVGFEIRSVDLLVTLRGSDPSSSSETSPKPDSSGDGLPRPPRASLI